MKFLKNIGLYFECLLMTKCDKYSIKKFYSFIFTILVVYLAIFTDNIDLITILLYYLAGLLVIRSFDKTNFKRNLKSKPPSITPEEEEPTDY